MKLRAVLSRHIRWGARLSARPLALPPEPKVCAAARMIMERHTSLSAAPPPFILENLEQKLRLASAHSSFEGVSKNEWSRAPYVFWQGLEPTLGQQAGFTKAYFQWLSAARKARPMRALIYAYLYGFDPKSPVIEDIAREVSSFLESTDRRSFALWAERAAEYHFFQPSKAPSTLASTLLSSNISVDQFFDETGLGREAMRSQFGRHVLREGIELVASTQATGGEPEASRRLTRLRQWLELHKPLSQLSQDFKCLIATKLLSPWSDREPSLSIVENLKTFILDMLGDPRTPGFQWTDKRLRACRETLLRLLAAETIDLFFAIIDAAADPWYWADRKAFWRGFHNAGAITDAWVAFGPRVLPVATQLGAKKELGFQFASLKEPNDRLHSVLFLRIRDLLVADYSHNGSCRFFLVTNPNTPSLYLTEYSDPMIRARASDALTHQGAWQQKFALYIYEKTGVRHPSVYARG